MSGWPTPVCCGLFSSFGWCFPQICMHMFGVPFLEKVTTELEEQSL